MSRTTIANVACACMLALCATVPAQAEIWNFEYRGFFNVETEQFDPGLVLRGEFYGSDSSGDGVIGLHELSGLVVDGFSYLDCRIGDGFYCNVSDFSYALTGALHFNLYERYNDEHMGGHSTNTRSGNFIFEESRDGGGNTRYQRHWRWTEQTAFTITPPPLPVPEPSALAMLAAGGLLLAARARRARRK